jgi:hypothetical protein
MDIASKIMGKQENLSKLIDNALEEKKLSYKEKKALPKGEFVFPKEKKYPIEDKAHARNALSRVSASGTPEEKKKVRAAVHRKYPNIGETKADKLISELIG